MNSPSPLSATRYLEKADAKIAYDFQNAEEKCTDLLVLLNGFQRNRHDFRAFRKRLHKQAPFLATLALDNRFSGETQVFDRNVRLTPEILAKDTLEIAELFLKELHLQKYHLLGISMGGMIAQACASLYPEKLDKLILVSTTAGGIGRTWPHFQDPAKRQVFQPTAPTYEGQKQKLERYFGKRFLEKSPILFEMMVKNIVKSSQAEESVENALKQFEVSAYFDWVDFLPRIKAQTLIVTGDDDQILRKENSDYLAQHIENAKMCVYEGIGHLILIENPDTFATDVANFLIR